MFVCLNGKFLKADEANISVFDHGFLYGDGVYETLRTYGGKVWQLEEHLKRLEKSATYTALRLPVSKKQIASWLEKLLKINGFKESRIRITLTRGVNNFDFVTCKKPTLLIQAQELRLEPAAVYSKGVNVISIPYTRILPQVKSISLLPFILARQKLTQQKAYEGLFVDKKSMVREGTITNVFMVKNGVLLTPRKNILMGTTRNVILQLAQKLGVKMLVQDFSLNKLYKADEIFITNAPRGIVPVCQVDGKLIGSGKPGPLTKKIMKAFHDYIHKILV